MTGFSGIGFVTNNIFPDTTDVDEMITGSRREGVISTFSTLIKKSVSGVMAAFVGAILQLFGVLVNQLLAHGLAQRAIRAADPEAVVGIASTGRLCYPERETPEDIRAAREATFAVSDDDWSFTHHWLLDPICLGKFPDCGGTALEECVRQVTPEDMSIIHAVPDVLGYNIYNGNAVRTDGTGYAYVPRYPGFPRTAMKAQLEKIPGQMGSSSQWWVKDQSSSETAKVASRAARISSGVSRSG